MVIFTLVSIDMVSLVEKGNTYGLQGPYMKETSNQERKMEKDGGKRSNKVKMEKP